MKKEKGLVFACDLRERNKALEVMKEIEEYIDAVKVNYPLILSTGIDFVSDLNKFAPVIADFKIADVPHTNKMISEEAFRAGASGIICHSFLGKESLLACKEKASEFNSEIYSVVEMSHVGSERFIHKHYRELCELSREVGVDGVIAPGNDLERLRKVRELIGEDVTILSPGIGFQGGETLEAINAGADFVIVGRKIYKSKKPHKVARKIKSKVMSF